MKYYKLIIYIISLSVLQVSGNITDPRDYSLVVKSISDGKRTEFEIIVNKNNIPKDVIIKSLSRAPRIEAGRYIHFRKEYFSEDKVIAIESLKLRVNGNMVNYTISIPKGVISYKIKEIDFINYLLHKNDWKWDPVLEINGK